MSMVLLAACWLISAPWIRSWFEVDSMRFDVVALSALIWSSTSFCRASACDTITAVRSAEIGGGLRAVDALDQLDVVLADQVEGHVALHRHRHLGHDVLPPLADREQRVGLERVGVVGLAGGLELGDLLR